LASGPHYLTREAEPLSFNLEAVRSALLGSAFSRVEYVPETGSTNDDAAALLGAPGAAGRVLVTGFQHAGRGRRARDWVAPPGAGLLFSAILPRNVAASALCLVPFWTGLCVADGIEAATGARVELQWPNDLLLDGAKCAGILCFSRVTGAIADVGCGVGLNVLRPDPLGELAHVVPAPAFLSDIAPRVEREALLTAILRAFEARLELLDAPAVCAPLWEERAALRGTPYALRRDGGAEIVRGTALGLAPDGSLIADVGGKAEHFALAEARVMRGG
jgi:BirA family biotin operon repressor/biotin-[acetyl-CoA-carboxylase] ligase